jgi:predicted RNase H-like nuclease (RuvC/YqgF family)
LALPQGSLQRLQEELQSHLMMMSAREEGEALLKAEVVRLTEENSQLRDELLEQRGTVMGLQERLAELAESGDSAVVAQVWPLPRLRRPPPSACPARRRVLLWRLLRLGVAGRAL